MADAQILAEHRLQKRFRFLHHRLLDDRIEPGIQLGVGLREVDLVQVEPLGREVAHEPPRPVVGQQPFDFLVATPVGRASCLALACSSNCSSGVLPVSRYAMRVRDLIVVQLARLFNEV